MNLLAITSVLSAATATAIMAGPLFRPTVDRRRSEASEREVSENQFANRALLQSVTKARFLVGAMSPYLVHPIFLTGLAAGVWLLTGPLLAGAGVAAAILARRLIGHRALHKQMEADRDALVGLAEHLARELRSGSTVALGVERAGTRVGVEPEFGKAFANTAQPFATRVATWQQMSTTRGHESFAAALLIANECGSGASYALDQVAGELRAARDAEAEARVQTAQSRTSTLVVGLMPVVFLMLSGILDTRLLSFLFTTTLGQVTLLVGAGLDLVGVWWMSRIVTRAAR